MRINIFLADNLTALAEAKAPVAEWLAQNAPAPETIIPRIFTNQHGIVDWRIGEDRSLFAAAHPAMLYRDWRPKDKTEGGATVIIGTALGYGLNHVLTGTPRSHKVLVIEPRPEMLVACLGQTDYRPFLAAGKLAFLPPDPKLVEKALTSLDVSFLFARINLRSDLPSTQLGPEYAQASALVRAKLESLSVELTTLRHKQETMVGNELRNYARAMEDGSLSRMAGMARGVPTVVLGAGPSLPRFVPALLRHRDKALFVAALQTLPVLERLGLAPDLCLGLDFNDSMNRCLDNLQDNNFAADIPLIYSTKMQPAVLDRYPGPKIPLWTQGGIATFVLKDQELVLDAGGNVGVTLERFLTWAGADRFFLVGQDLAWKEGSTHAPGHHSAGGNYTFSPQHDVRLKDIKGEDIYTHHGFLAAKRDIEKDIAATGASFYNIYGGGVVIKGAINIGPEDLERVDILPNGNAAREVFLGALARAARPRAKPVFSPKAESWATSLKNASRRLEKLMRKADRHQAEIKELLSQLQFFMRHDPLYMPYLYNEIMDMAGLIQTHKSYGAKELTAFKAIRRRVVTKIREIDARLGPSGSWAA
ncbi:MAG: motility associated factor glycosyltransferase family protein [Desulfovibrio sp.]